MRGKRTVWLILHLSIIVLMISDIAVSSCGICGQDEDNCTCFKSQLQESNLRTEEILLSGDINRENMQILLTESVTFQLDKLINLEPTTEILGNHIETLKKLLEDLKHRQFTTDELLMAQSTQMRIWQNLLPQIFAFLTIILGLTDVISSPVK